MLVTEEGNYLFVHKVEPENTQKKKSHTANSKLFVKTFCTFVAKYLKENKICSYIFPLTMFVPRSSRETFRILEQIMYADKYSCISSRQIEAIVDIPCIQNIEMLLYNITNLSLLI